MIVGGCFLFVLLGLFFIWWLAGVDLLSYVRWVLFIEIVSGLLVQQAQERDVS